mmetsp:Transcript_32636/g.66635  ORF Transcript_32636/g.66635 Transcript_32636/m.66635 type:complete len:219 (+) Transcript_32636:1146-1802(+)
MHVHHHELHQPRAEHASGRQRVVHAAHVLSQGSAQGLWVEEARGHGNLWEARHEQHLDGQPVVEGLELLVRLVHRVLPHAIHDLDFESEVWGLEGRPLRCQRVPQHVFVQAVEPPRPHVELGLVWPVHRPLGLVGESGLFLVRESREPFARRVEKLARPHLAVHGRHASLQADEAVARVGIPRGPQQRQQVVGFPREHGVLLLEQAQQVLGPLHRHGL